jgi:hypothetical protein
MITIPFADFPSFTEEITIDNIPLRFVFRWNSIGNFWVMSIADRDQNPIVSGIKLVVQYEILSRYISILPVSGELYVVDGQGKYDEILQDDFTNGRLELVYVPEGENVAV